MNTTDDRLKNAATLRVTEREMAVVGAILAHGQRAIDVVSGRISAEDFNDPLLAEIFSLAVTAAAKGNSLSPTRIAKIVDDSAHEAGGGPAIVAKLTGMASPVVSLDMDVAVISEAAQRRRLLEVAADMESLATDWKSDLDSDIARISRSLADVLASGGSGGLALAGDSMDCMLDGTIISDAVKTGIHDLDHRIAGLRRGATSIIAGRPGMGKSMVAAHIAANCARAGMPSAIFSLEMPRQAVLARLVTEEVARKNVSYSLLRPSYREILAGKLQEAHRDDVRTAIETIRALPLSIDDRGGLQMGQINAAAAKWCAETRAAGKEPGVVVIDHLGLARANTPRLSPYEAMTEKSADAMVMAKALQIPVLLVCQLSRETDKQGDKRPMLHHLRDSGSLEQDAEIVMMLYREAYYLEKEAEGAGDKAEAAMLRLEAVRNSLEIIVAKARYGPTGTVKVFCDMATGQVGAAYQDQDGDDYDHI